MERTTLTATTRGIGKGHARRARVAGAVPAVLYGKGRDPQALVLDAKLVGKALQTSAGMNVLVDLAVDGKAAVVSRFKEVQKDPIRGALKHLDLQAIDLKQKIVVEIPIHFVGKAEGVKNEGGILEISRRSIEVRCLPTAIPGFLEVDISPLRIGENLHANDLTLPAGVEFPHTENFSIVQVVAPQKEEEVTPAVAVVAAPGEEGAAAAAAGTEKAAGAEKAATPSDAKAAAPKKGS